MKARYEHIINTLPEHVALIAVSKYYPASAISELYELGQRSFGESRASELKTKAESLPKDIEWHFIGHLQRSNVKHVVPYVSLIHSVDNLRLLEEINKQAMKLNRTTDCLLQIRIAKEETKTGFTMLECRNMLEAGDWKGLQNIRICGLMCMATNTDDDQQIREEFSSVNSFFQEIKSSHFSKEDCFCIRSWGMSDDRRIAIEEGSNMVRIGTALFGEH